jgi:hypothetical protein
MFAPLASAKTRLRTIFALLALFAISGRLVAQRPATPPRQFPETAGQRVTQLKPLLADALRAARQWKPDAVLTSLSITAEADGFIDLGNLAGPPRFDGGIVVATYVSLSSRQMMGMVLNAKGQWDAGVGLQITSPLSPLPDEFLDLDAALRQAQAQGLPLPKPGRRNRIAYTLSAEANQVAGTVQATWKITSMEIPPTLIPQVLGEVLIVAGSGQPTTRDEAAGITSQVARLDRLKAGRPLPPGAVTVADWRRAADQMAQEYRPDLRPYEVSCVGRLAGAAYAPRLGVFRYFGLSQRPTVDGEWDTTEVRCDGRRLWIESFDTLQRVDRFFPREIPDNVLTPEAALAEIRKIFPRLEPNDLPLLLCHTGLLSADTSRAAEPFGPQLTGNPSLTLPDRWAWRTVATFQQEIVAAPFRGVRDVQDFVYLPATPDVEADKRQSPLLDPQLVGTWQAEMSGSLWIWTIHDDSSYSFTASGPGAAAPHDGMVFARNGRWTLESTTTAWSDVGTYAIRDAGSVEFTGRLGSVIWRRTGSARP